jgi:hypothetical protein
MEGGSGAEGSERPATNARERLPRAGSPTDRCSRGQANRRTWALSECPLLSRAGEAVPGASETDTGRWEPRSGPEAIGKCADNDGNVQKALQESGDD